METSQAQEVFVLAQLHTSAKSFKVAIHLSSFLPRIPVVIALSLAHLFSIHLPSWNDGLLAAAWQLQNGRGLLVVMVMARLRCIGCRSCEYGRQRGGDGFDLRPWKGRGGDGTCEYEECETHREKGYSNTRDR